MEGSMKPFMIINGHDLRIARIAEGGGDPGRKRRGVKQGLVCYNCGVYTLNANWRELIADPHRAFEIVQCGQAQVDVFGPPIFNREDYPPPRYWGKRLQSMLMCARS